MISHTSQDNIMAFVKKIKDIYGENLAEKVGTVHDYLGMTFDFSFDDKVRINMNQYLLKVIKEFPQDISGMCALPASDHLYKIQENGKKLNEELVEAFHHTTYQSYLLPIEHDVTSRQLCCFSPHKYKSPMKMIRLNWCECFDILMVQDT
jgi:hypothetical protein